MARGRGPARKLRVWGVTDEDDWRRPRSPVRQIYAEREPETLLDALLATANTIEVDLYVSGYRFTV